MRAMTHAKLRMVDEQTCQNGIVITPDKFLRRTIHLKYASKYVALLAAQIHFWTMMRSCWTPGSDQQIS
eukprot:11058091-Prorocentrum_lima.AAC.1